jgi:hypothetical protein
VCVEAGILGRGVQAQVAPLIAGGPVAGLGHEDVRAVGGEEVLDATPAMLALAVARPDERQSPFLAVRMPQGGLVPSQWRILATAAVGEAVHIWDILNSLMVARRKPRVGIDAGGWVLAVAVVVGIGREPVPVIRMVPGCMPRVGEPEAGAEGWWWATVAEFCLGEWRCHD